MARSWGRWLPSQSGPPPDMRPPPPRPPPVVLAARPKPGSAPWAPASASGSNPGTEIINLEQSENRHAKRQKTWHHSVAPHTGAYSNLHLKLTSHVLAIVRHGTEGKLNPGKWWELEELAAAVKDLLPESTEAPIAAMIWQIACENVRFNIQCTNGSKLIQQNEEFTARENLNYRTLERNVVMKQVKVFMPVCANESDAATNPIAENGAAKIWTISDLLHTTPAARQAKFGWTPETWYEELVHFPEQVQLTLDGSDFGQCRIRRLKTW